VFPAARAGVCMRTRPAARMTSSGLRGIVTGPPLPGYSATPAAERKKRAARLASGEPMLVVGTHALLEDKVPMPNLALAIVDEQHRFGVEQRAALAKKGVLLPKAARAATPHAPGTTKALPRTAAPPPTLTPLCIRRRSR